MTAIRSAASDNNVTLVVGVIERCNESSSGPSRESYGSLNHGGFATLYCKPLSPLPPTPTPFLLCLTLDDPLTHSND